jgi:hypothetical protein
VFVCELWLCGCCVVVVWGVGLIGIFFVYRFREWFDWFFFKFKVCNCCFSDWGG